MKTIIISEDKLKKNKGILLENQIMDLKLPKFLFNKLKVHKTSLGENEAFPPDDVYPFDYYIIKHRFFDVSESIKGLNDLESLDEDYLSSELSRCLKRCKAIEKPIRENLCKVCENVLTKLFIIPDETVNFSCSLVDKIETKEAIRVFPEDSDNRTFDFDDLNDFSAADKAIYKRRLINSLIQGASYSYSTICELFMDEINTLNGELIELYDRILTINDYLLFIKEEKISDKNPMQGGYVEVTLGRPNERTDIKAQGYIFPFLLMESIRGYFELFASHGLPQDKEKANYILSMSDFVYAEPWDLRFGVGLWNKLTEGIDDTTIIPYFFSSLCKMKIENFNQALKEIFAHTKYGQKLKQSFIEKSTRSRDMHDFETTLKQKNAIRSIIADNYFTADELDNLELDDIENNNIITEE